MCQRERVALIRGQFGESERQVSASNGATICHETVGYASQPLTEPDMHIVREPTAHPQQTQTNPDQPIVGGPKIIKWLTPVTLHKGGDRGLLGLIEVYRGVDLRRNLLSHAVNIFKLGFRVFVGQ